MNSKGQVIGVNTFIVIDKEALGFAVPINYLRGLMATMGKPMSLNGDSPSSAIGLQKGA